MASKGWQDLKQQVEGTAQEAGEEAHGLGIHKGTAGCLEQGPALEGKLAGDSGSKPVLP